MAGTSADWRWIESGMGLPTRELETMGQETHATELGPVPDADTNPYDRQSEDTPAVRNQGGAPAKLGSTGAGVMAFLDSRVNRIVVPLVYLPLLVAALGAASPPAPLFRHEPLNVANGCFVESVYFYDQFQERFGGNAWVRVLQWGAQENDETVAGHAVAVFLHNDRLWVWDVNHGFLPLDLPPAQREEVDRISPLILARYPRITPRYPLYRFDFPQAPAATAPTVLLLDENSAFRDASVVAARLARHRPVNLLQYSYIDGDQTKTSAAAIFLFHGRLCVYFPESGTVPFLTRLKTVENLRQIQECLRRLHAGAFAVKPLGAGTNP